MMNGTLRECVELAVKAAGGPKALARSIGISSQAISQWARIPAERVPAVARATQLPPHLLRPDLYQAPKLSTGVSA